MVPVDHDGRLEHVHLEGREGRERLSRARGRRADPSGEVIRVCGWPTGFGCWGAGDLLRRRGDDPHHGGGSSHRFLRG